MPRTRPTHASQPPSGVMNPIRRNACVE